MVVYPCDIHKVSRLLTGKNGQLKKEIPSVAMMTNFGFGPSTHRFFILKQDKKIMVSNVTASNVTDDSLPKVFNLFHF